MDEVDIGEDIYELIDIGGMGYRRTERKRGGLGLVRSRYFVGSIGDGCDARCIKKGRKEGRVSNMRLVKSIETVRNSYTVLRTKKVLHVTINSRIIPINTTALKEQNSKRIIFLSSQSL